MKCVLQFSSAFTRKLSNTIMWILFYVDAYLAGCGEPLQKLGYVWVADSGAVLLLFCRNSVFWDYVIYLLIHFAQ